MDLNLTDKIFVITGGTQGIGEAITTRIAEEGGIPVCIGLDDAHGPALASNLHERGLSCHFIPEDLTQEGSCKLVVSKILKGYGNIHGLINNFGINDGIGLEHGSPEAFKNSVYRNLMHVYEMAHFALPSLKNTRGSIVNIGSKTAVTGQGGTSGYTAAKGGILSLTREWAVELLKYGIRVNAVIPAEVWTPLYERWIQRFPNPQATLEEITQRIPLEKRMTTTKEIADTVLFLLSE
ncbi:MAG: hypothetical protein RLZZ241_1103, partial [Bacteroidota bacterium]